MSTKTEPYRKYVAHDEKSKFFIFFPEIAYEKGGVIFFLKYFLNPPKKSKIRYSPTSGRNTQNSVTNTLS